MGHDATIREFTRQAPFFERPGSHFADVEILDWIAAAVAVGPNDRVLDVAGGTGQLGRHLGRNAQLTVVLDLTPAMLREGAGAVRAAGRTDVIFLEADAQALPFPDEQFEVVASRFALHHLDDVRGALGEMARVCAPGGTVAIVDMVAEAGPAGERHDELERLRDPSHVRCLREEELLALMGDVGLRPTTQSQRVEELHAEAWLDRAGPEPEHRQAVLQALATEASDGCATGLAAHMRDSELAIAHHYVLVAAEKPATSR